MVMLCSQTTFAAELTGKAKQELDKFQGTWVLDNGEKGGEPASDEHLKRGHLVYKGREITVDVPHLGTEEQMHATFCRGRSD